MKTLSKPHTIASNETMRCPYNFTIITAIASRNVHVRKEAFKDTLPCLATVYKYRLLYVSMEMSVA